MNTFRKVIVRLFYFFTLFTFVYTFASFASSEAPHFTSEPPNYVSFSNNTGTVISCSATGHPTPEISWRTPEMPSIISDVPGLRYQRSDGSLVFPPFAAHKYRQEIHHSKYQCIASNSHGTIGSRNVHVQAGTFAY
ncbi:hypothetical protein B4U80_01551 [Leptotrombidium deliense]|uniref:Ig-like domain-containing protein n=1 Tax=Leptotrombidium deliense TaxID=299467 RepID=A0A443SUY7_9ACAR|nr:hypothetical protein B4U80_01551 [Leptotrombidium deliense]